MDHEITTEQDIQENLKTHSLSIIKETKQTNNAEEEQKYDHTETQLQKTISHGHLFSTVDDVKSKKRPQTSFLTSLDEQIRKEINMKVILPLSISHFFIFFIYS